MEKGWAVQGSTSNLKQDGCVESDRSFPHMGPCAAGIPGHTSSRGGLLSPAKRGAAPFAPVMSPRPSTSFVPSPMPGRRPKQLAATPLLKFGVISDIQYADIPDGQSYHGTPRYYRNALVALKRTIDVWAAAADLDFAIHFGDILDGFQPKDSSHDALSDVLSEFDRLRIPTYHLIGNHCLYNMERPVLNAKLGLGLGCSSGVSYYSVQPAPGLRIVFADGYDLSVLGWPPGHPSHEAAVQLLAARNPNANKNMPEGLEGVERRFVQFGGGASGRQLEWIRGQILEAAAAQQKVLVCCHLAFCPGSCPNACLLWNYEEMLQVLRTTAPGVVVATMAGHTHQNGYVMDECGIHHVVLPAVLETPPGRDCYGSVEVYEHGMELRGVDTMMSLSLPFVTAPAAVKATR